MPNHEHTGSKIIEILKLAREIETQSRDAFFDEPKLAELQTLIRSLEDDKLSRIADHLTPTMTLRHFLNFMLPLERVYRTSLASDDLSIDDKIEITSLDQPQKTVERVPVVFVLDNLRSAFNVGSIFRTAEAFGIERVILCGYTPTPEDNTVSKTSMGASSLINWQHVEKIDEALAQLKKEGFTLIALETSPQAASIYTRLEDRVAFVFGNERFGLDPLTCSQCDEVRKINLRGVKNSLNVSITTGIAIAEWTRQHGK